MNSDCVCAVVVTFHPDAAVPAHLSALRAQVDRLIVVDNGSREAELSALRALSRSLGFDLIEHGENRGIAAALNTGIRRSREAGDRWIFLFDQDSCVSEGFVAAMLRGWRESKQGERLKILMPRYVDKRCGKALPAARAKEGLAVATTSGSLAAAATFEQFGLFAEELFIDQVDYEFSLRVRRNGGIIDEAPDAVLLHAPGEPQPFRLLGRTLFHTPNYSPLRRYYQQRNMIWMLRHYGWAFPRFCLGLLLASGKDLLKLLLAERDRVKKCRAILRGTRDGIFARMGRLDKGT